MATKTATKTVSKSAPGKAVKCCFKGCQNEAKSRGLCPNHYQGAAKAVAAGKATWAELVRLGAAKEAKERGPGFLDFVKGLRAKNKAAKAASGGKAAPAAARKTKKAGKPKATAPKAAEPVSDWEKSDLPIPPTSENSSQES